MRNNNKKFFIAFCVFVFLCFCVLTQGVMAEDTVDKSYGDYGLDKTLEIKDKESGTKLKDVLKEKELSILIGQIVGAGLAFIGVLFLILMIYGGFLWMTAAGNSEQVGKAISIMMQAGIGLAIVAAAYLITKFVGESVLNLFISK